MFRLNPLFARYANLSLLILFPIAWFAPLMRAGLLPMFGMNEITVMTGLQSLWGSDVFLALLVGLLVIVLPIVKIAGLALVQFGLIAKSVKPALATLAKLAMADVFLLAIYIVIAKGVGVGKVETAWGLYLFTACVIASLLLSLAGDKESA